MTQTMKYSILIVLLCLTAFVGAEAKRVKAQQMYLLGFSASFKDSVVYITDIQDVQGAWIDNKTNFLLGRESYSAQMKEYFDKHQQPNRVCVTFFDTSRKKMEKRLEKLKKRYVLKHPGLYDVRYLSVTDFKYEAIDMAPDEE